MLLREKERGGIFFLRKSGSHAVPDQGEEIDWIKAMLSRVFAEDSPSLPSSLFPLFPLLGSPLSFASEADIAFEGCDSA